MGATRLKYLFLLFGDDEDVYQEITKEGANPDLDIAAEACLRQGLIHLLYRSSSQDDMVLIRELDEAGKLFTKASNLVENRIDAQFFGYVTQYLTALLATNFLAAENAFSALSATLWQRQVWGWLPEAELIEGTIFRALTNLRIIIEHTVAEQKWYDVKKELTFLCKRVNDLIALDSLTPQFTPAYQQFAGGAVDTLLNRYYEQNLSASILRIDSMQGELSEEESDLSDFLTNLRERLQRQQQKKKDSLVEPIAELHLLFPHIGLDELTSDFQKLVDEGINPDKAIIRLTHRLIIDHRASQTDFLTGYSIGDQVLHQLASRLYQLIPDYAPRRMSAFLEILADIVRYAYQSIVEDRASFSILYDSKVTDERSFHSHLLMRLKAGGRATYYVSEDSNAIGGGRIDIVYRNGDLVYPIEIKKTLTKPTWETIQDDYLGQAQTYVHPYNQLGLLITFDLSPKEDEGPVNNFKDLFQILHMQSYYSISERNPDFIVAVLIPGNKISPSQYTRYKR